MENGSLMKVEGIAECSPWSILQYFWPVLSDNQSWKPFFVFFFEWPLRTCFTVIFNNTFYFILSSSINAYQKQIKVILITSEMISAYIFTVAFFLLPLTFPFTECVHFRTSNAHNFRICEQKHQVWVYIFSVRMWQYQNYMGLLKIFSTSFLQGVRHCMYSL